MQYQAPASPDPVTRPQVRGGQHRNQTRPSISLLSTGPNARLSWLSLRLSPKTKYSSGPVHHSPSRSVRSGSDPATYVSSNNTSPKYTSPESTRMSSLGRPTMRLTYVRSLRPGWRKTTISPRQIRFQEKRGRTARTDSRWANAGSMLSPSTVKRAEEKRFINDRRIRINRAIGHNLEVFRIGSAPIGRYCKTGQSSKQSPGLSWVFLGSFLVLSQLGFGNCLRKRLRLLPFFRSVDVGGWQPWDENGMWSGWKGKNETSWND